MARWERSPQCAAQAWGWDLAEAVAGSLREALYDRALALYEREERSEQALTRAMLDPRGSSPSSLKDTSKP